MWPEKEFNVTQRALAKSSFCCLCCACPLLCSIGMALNITSYPAAPRGSLSGWDGGGLVLGTHIRKGIAAIWEKALGQTVRHRVKFHPSEGKGEKKKKEEEYKKEKYCQMSMYY